MASVHRNIDDREEMAEAWDDLSTWSPDLGLSRGRSTWRAAGPVVQTMAPPGVALVV